MKMSSYSNIFFQIFEDGGVCLGGVCLAGCLPEGVSAQTPPPCEQNN